MSLFRNAAPEVIMLGANDKSNTQIPVSAEPIPQHLPLFYMFSQKGPAKRNLVGGAGLTNLYGSKSFDINGKYFNHQTRYLQSIAGTGNTCMVNRLVPLDAGDEANAIIYACVLNVNGMDTIARNSDGSYRIDPTSGGYLVDGTDDGYAITFMKEYTGDLPKTSPTPAISSYANGLHYQNNAITAAGVTTAGGWGKYGELPLDTLYDGAYGSGQLYGHQVVETSTRVYIIGGYEVTYDDNADTVYSAVKYADGSISEFTLENFRLPRGVMNHKCIITNGYLYVIGGETSSAGSRNIYNYSIDVDGTIIPSTYTIQAALPVDANASQIFVVNSKIYCVGGIGSTDIAYASIGSNGVISSWFTYTGAGYILDGTNTLSNAGVIVTGKRETATDGIAYKVYLIGGILTDTNSIVTLSNSVYELIFDENGQPLITLAGKSFITKHTAVLPAGLAAFQMYATKDKYHIFGGLTDSATANLQKVSDAAYTFELDANQDLVTDTLTPTILKVQMDYTSEYVGVAYGQLFITTNRAYIVGGYVGNNILVNSYSGSAVETETYYNSVFSTAINDGWLIKSNYSTAVPLSPKVDIGAVCAKPVTMGTQTGIAYPIFEFRAKEKGEYYNNLAFSISPITGTDVNTKAMLANKTLTYSLALYARPDENSSPSVIRSLYGETSIPFSFKEKVVDPVTNIRYDLENVFGNNWYNETDPLLPYKPFEFDNVHVYHDNIDTLLTMFAKKEAPYVDDNSIAWYDFTTTDSTLIVQDEKYLLDMFTCSSTTGVPYYTLTYFKDGLDNLTPYQSEIMLTSNTPVFLSGASDGSLTNEMFELLVKQDMLKYNDTESDVQDLAVNVESIFWDSGFTVPTKMELANFISLRKDTVLCLSTHDASLGNKNFTLTEERAIAVALKSRLNLTPESEYYGTGVARAIVVAGTGNLRDGSTDERIPQTYDIAMKAAYMMGAGTGKWKQEYIFDKAPGNIITTLTNIKPDFIPAGVKPTLWADGIVWSQPFDRTQFHFPAIQTVYSDDTSVLNSFFTVMGLATLNKIGAAAWRNFTGSTALTNGQFIDAVTAYVNKQLVDRFAGMFTVIPEVVITEEDAIRGYSWRLVNKLYASNMKTKMVYSTEVYRSSDLTTTA